MEEVEDIFETISNVAFGGGQKLFVLLVSPTCDFYNI